MELLEALNTSGQPLMEATLTQIIKRIKKHQAMVNNPSALARHLSGDNAFKSSLGTVENATDQEREQYAELLKDPMVSGAIEALPMDMKSAVQRFSKLKDAGSQDEPEQDGDPSARARGPLASMAKKDQDAINQMQTDFMRAKSKSDKEAVIRKWTGSTYNAKLYKLAVKSGIIS